MPSFMGPSPLRIVRGARLLSGRPVGLQAQLGHGLAAGGLLGQSRRRDHVSLGRRRWSEGDVVVGAAAVVTAAEIVRRCGRRRTLRAARITRRPATLEASAAPLSCLRSTPATTAPENDVAGDDLGAVALLAVLLVA